MVASAPAAAVVWMKRRRLPWIGVFMCLFS
jgi:hypothetical protein